MGREGGHRSPGRQLLILIRFHGSSVRAAKAYFTQVTECSIRRRRTSWSSLPKWPRPSDPNGFHRHPFDQLPVRLHSALLQPFCKVSQPVLQLRTPRHCLRDTQPTAKPGLSLTAIPRISADFKVKIALPEEFGNGKSRKAGFFGMTISVDYCGRGANYLDAVLVICVGPMRSC